ncbi:hypothetical protein B0H66DRAFT_573570 [Apodospora peruviana]|uniref:Uncharacterized protein n=1 Tax=Apodospora peruviana TaxID=516989 RepID=A0AAE0IIX6_9PEZI|nr:hypothetical protein B0H66DRAFT_573570 [Apodospora peruviana]
MLRAKESRVEDYKDSLSLADSDASFGAERSYVFNPYPKYNSDDWRAAHAEYVPCHDPADAEVEDIHVFKGYPKDFPGPGFGSYNVLGIDQNICYGRHGRLGQYGLEPDKSKDATDWESLDWGKLQNACVERNKARFGSERPPNIFVTTGTEAVNPDAQTLLQVPRRSFHSQRSQDRPLDSARNSSQMTRESRTAVLLRSFTGKEYTDNDKQVIRSLITELNFRSGGEYQVFLFVHVKKAADIWRDNKTYQDTIEAEIPREFWGITVLWNDESVRQLYTNLEEKPSRVHNGQYLSVQMFMQQHREFDYVWNWEMDSRVVGHNYDFVNKLAEFSRKQPRKGLWERNERFYIRDIHGEYDTEFRQTIEGLYGNDIVWGAPKVEGVDAMGPQPPAPTPENDNYEWGVGEDADLITLAPIFNPIDSDWILRNQVWGYPVGTDLPRRATIITQCRLSRRLVDLMHAEDLRGKHVGSEMQPQTVSLLHGLKAVYAPMPVFFDRPWTGAQLARYFNGGPKGASGGPGSAFGWGRERRFEGSTWYFRATPPLRLYNNWMGYEDTGIGGPEWEKVHGPPCLPAMILHPIKDVRPTEPGSATKIDFPYRR